MTLCFVSNFIFLFSDLPKCHIQVNDVLIEKSVGDVWNSTSDTCMKHTCEVDDRGNAVERTFREYCTAHHTCNDVSSSFLEPQLILSLVVLEWR